MRGSSGTGLTLVRARAQVDCARELNENSRAQAKVLPKQRGERRHPPPLPPFLGEDDQEEINVPCVFGTEVFLLRVVLLLAGLICCFSFSPRPEWRWFMFFPFSPPSLFFMCVPAAHNNNKNKQRGDAFLKTWAFSGFSGTVEAAGMCFATATL